MTTVKIRGFTIIEVMLFLAVSGGLFAALLFGVNNGITQQRYKDSVYSFSSFLQKQYSEVLNTRNERTNDYSCDESTGTITDVSGALSASPAPSTSPRGASKCVILGRAVIVTTNTSTKQTTVESYPVSGIDTDTDSNKTDIDVLKASRPTIVKIDALKTTYDMEWNSWIGYPSGVTTTDSSYLILRSPTSGALKVFTSSKDLLSISVICDTSHPNDGLCGYIKTLTPTDIVVSCIKNDNRGIQPISSVTLDPRIAGPSGVSVQGDGTGC